MNEADHALCRLDASKQAVQRTGGEVLTTRIAGVSLIPVPHPPSSLVLYVGLMHLLMRLSASAHGPIEENIT